MTENTRATTGRSVGGCSHDIADTMPAFVTSASFGTNGTCVLCLSEQLEVSMDDARTIAARLGDPCNCGIPHRDICWDCQLSDDPHEPRCPDALVRSDYCDIHDFGAITTEEFRALPDWPGRAEQPITAREASDE